MSGQSKAEQSAKRKRSEEIRKLEKQSLNGWNVNITQNKKFKKTSSPNWLIIILVAVVICECIVIAAFLLKKAGSASKYNKKNNEETGDIKIDEAHFPDETFRQIIEDQYDLDGDGILSIKERSIDEFKVGESDYYEADENNGCTSYEGIEYFPDIVTFVSGSDDNVLSMDFSNNKKLQMLIVVSSSVKTIDISECAELTTIDLWTESLEEVDFSKCTKLKDISLYSLEIKEIDISQNTELEAFEICNMPQIYELDISNNPKLVDLEYDGCKNVTIIE
jgi:Leucine-rich repeat (LRR) protein